MHDRLRKKCNEDGCNTNDFIRNMLEAELTEENCQDQENNSKSIPSIEDIPEAKVIKMSNDGGKTWYDVQDNSDKPIHEVEI